MNLHKLCSNDHSQIDYAVATGLNAALVFTVVVALASTAQSFDWQTTVGGDDNDLLFWSAPASDEGYAFAGYSYSGVSGNKTSSNYGGRDFWLVKLGANGGVQWDKSYGGADWDEAYAVHQTVDGGHILGGRSYSGAEGNKNTASFGDSDCWLVKVDSGGNKQWERVFGGTDYDAIYAMLTNGAGGYLLLGESYSEASGNKTNANLGGEDTADYWLIKTDANGDKQWERVFGGDGDDYPYAIAATSDGGFVLGGSSDSGISGNKTNENFGDFDYWVVKVDAEGNKEWERVYGGDGWDEVTAIKATSDGGYIVAGSSESGVSGNKTIPNFDEWDWWLIKLDADGNKQWESVLGGTNGEDYLNQVHETSDGGFVLVGTSWSDASGNKTSDNIGDSDYWFVKVDGNGNKLWEHAFGGTGEDYPWIIQPTGDGEYLIAGHSGSDTSGTKNSDSFGFWDGWILKLSVSDTPVPMLSIAHAVPNGVVVSWPSSATGYSIQQNTEINNTDGWEAPSETVNEDGTNKYINVVVPDDQKYYRLIKTE